MINDADIYNSNVKANVNISTNSHYTFNNHHKFLATPNFLHSWCDYQGTAEELKAHRAWRCPHEM